MKLFGKIIFLYVIYFLFYFVTDTSANPKIQEGEEKSIEIFADDGIEWNKQRKVYIAKGNAKAIRGNASISSDLLQAKYIETKNSDNKITFIKAVGNVVIKNETAEINGGKDAIYDVNKEYIIVKGNQLKVVSDLDELRATSKIEYWKRDNIAIATGNAVAKKENNYIIKANKLVWHIKKNEKDAPTDEYKIKKMIAYDNVVIETKNEVAYSDKALYNKGNEICKLYGNVKLKKDNNYLTGEYAEINLNTGISKLLPYPSNKAVNKNRVKAIIKTDE
tara:strand:- start:102 stop:932 length:831 start_codon:yes stop_codon:yes gene_type:complete